MLVEKRALRYTPAGLPVLEAEFRHSGTVVEAGTQRSLEFEVGTRALGEVAGRLEREALGADVELTGFIAPRSQRTRRLVLHITGYSRFVGD